MTKIIKVNECPKCGYNEAEEIMKTIPEEHDQCLSCKWWTCGGVVGSYCGNESSITRNIEGNCGYYEKG